MRMPGELTDVYMHFNYQNTDLVYSCLKYLPFLSQGTSKHIRNTDQLQHSFACVRIPERGWHLADVNKLWTRI